MAKWYAFRAANRNIGKAVREEPFDPEKERTAFAQADARSVEFRTAIQAMAIEISSKISAEGRKKLHVPGAF
jgi:hypothetical protein